MKKKSRELKSYYVFHTCIDTKTKPLIIEEAEYAAQSAVYRNNGCYKKNYFAKFSLVKNVHILYVAPKASFVII